MVDVNVENFNLTNLEDPKFVKPVRINYKQNGTEKTWEAVKSHDSVAVLLYHKQKDVFILVKQFRPPVYMNHAEYDFTYELCAGIVDKDKPLVQIAKEEIEEECGYDINVEEIKFINSFFTNVGVSGGKQHLFFAMIDDKMKIHEGGGINDEHIELEYLKVSDSKKFIYDTTKAKTPGLMFAFYWFYEKFNKF
ncbi:MAG: NUDIX hydrolase [Campylobacterota bacterium]|nr:NUDIX hydrolase [Campylobacterota bacterium]